MHNNNALFIGHGSPINAISSQEYSKFLAQYAKSIDKPEAIVVISAHWQTNGTCITANPHPQQIYDFWGFPEELYAVHYAPKGSPEIAKRIVEGNSGIKVDNERGIDHAGWAVVKHMYPEQDVALLEISLDINKSEKEHFELGRKLSRYCREGILFIGSGNVIHNLRNINFDDNAKPFEWAISADAWMKEKIEMYDIDQLVNYRIAMPDYLMSFPTNEHFIPLLYILGMKDESQRIKTVYEEKQNGSIYMRSVEIS